MSELSKQDKWAMTKEALSDMLIACIGGSTAVIAVLIFSAFGILEGEYNFVYASYVLFCSGAGTTLMTRMIKTYLGGSKEIKEKLKELDAEVAETVQYQAEKLKADIERDKDYTVEIADSVVSIPNDQEIKEGSSWGT